MKTHSFPGDNDFSAETGVFIRVQAGVSSTIYAGGNTFPDDPPEETADRDNLGTGSVVWGGAQDREITFRHFDQFLPFKA